MRPRSLPALYLAFASTALILILPARPCDARSGRGQQLRAEVPLLDTIDIVVRPRSILAVDPTVGFDVARISLEVSEDVLWAGARGRIALVVTDKRVLAISTGTPFWQEARFLIRESLPTAILVGDRVALVTTSHRMIGMGSGGGPLRVRDIGTHEELIDAVIGENLAVVITDKRVLGLSGFSGGFTQEPVGIYEDLEYAKASADFATVATDRRLLVFEAASGDWRARRFNID